MPTATQLNTVPQEVSSKNVQEIHWRCCLHCTHTELDPVHLQRLNQRAMHELQRKTRLKLKVEAHLNAVVDSLPATLLACLRPRMLNRIWHKTMIMIHTSSPLTCSRSAVQSQHIMAWHQFTGSLLSCKWHNSQFDVGSQNWKRFCIWLYDLGCEAGLGFQTMKSNLPFEMKTLDFELEFQLSLLLRSFWASQFSKSDRGSLNRSLKCEM